MLDLHILARATVRGLSTGCVLLGLRCLRMLPGATVGRFSGGGGSSLVRLDLRLRVLSQGGRGDREGSSNGDVLKRHVLLHGFLPQGYNLS